MSLGRATRAVPAAVGILIAAGVIYLFFHDADSGGLYPPADRKQLSELSLPRLDGTPWHLSEQRGKVVLLNFWATWCPPCREETPALVELSERYAPEGFRIAGIAMDEDGRAIVQRFVTEHRIPYPILLPSERSRVNLSSTLRGLPTSVLLDRQLRIAKTYVGAFPKSTFSRDIAELLKEPAAAGRATPVSDQKLELVQFRMM